MQCASGRDRRSSTTSRGCGGPAAISPPTTIASTPSRSTSASTASSAGRFPWMSYSAATRSSLAPPSGNSNVSTGHFRSGIASDALFHDLEQRAAAPARGRGADDRAQRTGDAALAADHLAHVVLGHVELDHQVAVAVDLLDPDRVRLVDQATGQVLDELSRARHPWPSAGAGRWTKAARPSRANP